MRNQIIPQGLDLSPMLNPTNIATAVRLAVTLTLSMLSADELKELAQVVNQKDNPKPYAWYPKVATLFTNSGIGVHHETKLAIDEYMAGKF